ncbi:histidine kinase dimerization/phosphoacceptor domain -containing protein [Flammeovirga sp. SubArs3]|uniref:tetratricopeptide repeat-containing sensor histidine kinase n=1 Tax=Flammeovirga sp. SubArs3 TaxID=2995316 RepID=UPI00248C0D99|nr:histidine kinase dimerization/phosphoacceptor domain -containing protein [Flammeovirga sp. SubArs3]
MTKDLLLCFLLSFVFIGPLYSLSTNDSLEYSKIQKRAVELNNRKGVQLLDSLIENIDDINWKLSLLQEKASILRVLGEFDEAIQQNFEILSIANQQKNESLINMIYGELGTSYAINQEYDESIKYIKKTKPYFLKEEEWLLLIKTDLNLGEVYRLNNQLDSAQKYFQLAKDEHKKYKNEITNKTEYDLIEGYIIGNLGMVQKSQFQYKDAKVNLTKAIDLLTPFNDAYSICFYLTDLAVIEAKSGKKEYAEKLLKNAYKSATEQQLKEQIRDITEALSIFYEEEGDYKKALLYEKEFVTYKDSLLNKESIQKIERAKHNYEMDKVALEMELLDQKATFRTYFSIFSFSLALLFFILVIIIYITAQKRKKTNVLLLHQKEQIALREEEKALLLKELNHRVKNNLQMISSLLNLQSSQLGDHPAVKAIDSGRFRVEAMSLIHQKLYQKDVHTEIEIDSYIKELVLNLMYSFNNEVETKFEIGRIAIHIDRAIPLGLVINELVTNAMKYAFDGIENPRLLISLQEEEDQLVLKVIDNGVGMENTTSTSTSFGLNLVNSLVKQLDGTLTYQTDNGTTCILLVPLT